MRFRRRSSPATASNPAASDSRTNARRRGFLLTLGVGGAGAAALAARSLSSLSREDDGAAAEDSKGYRVTEHVKRYYRTAKI
jgi:hypothetical protein